MSVGRRGETNVMFKKCWTANVGDNVKALNSMKSQFKMDFLEVLDAFGRQSSQQSSRQPSRSLSPSPVVGQEMFDLSQESFEDMFGTDHTTPKKRDQSPRHDTPYGKVPYGFNPFGGFCLFLRLHKRHSSWWRKQLHQAQL